MRASRERICKEMLTLSRSYGTATFKGRAGEDKPAKDTERNGGQISKKRIV